MFLALTAAIAVPACAGGTGSRPASEPLGTNCNVSTKIRTEHPRTQPLTVTCRSGGAETVWHGYAFCPADLVATTDGRTGRRCPKPWIVSLQRLDERTGEVVSASGPAPQVGSISVPLKDAARPTPSPLASFDEPPPNRQPVRSDPSASAPGSSSVRRPQPATSFY